MGFCRQEYWSGLACPPSGDLRNPGIEPASLTSLALAGRFFTTGATVPSFRVNIPVPHQGRSPCLLLSQSWTFFSQFLSQSGMLSVPAIDQEAVLVLFSIVSLVQRRRSNCNSQQKTEVSVSNCPVRSPICYTEGTLRPREAKGTANTAHWLSCPSLLSSQGTHRVAHAPQPLGTPGLHLPAPRINGEPAQRGSTRPKHV